MFYRLLVVTLFTFFIVGCGGGGSSGGSKTDSGSESSNGINSVVIDDVNNNIQEKVVDNLGVVIQKEFESYDIVVLCDKKLSESEEISQGTKALYGKINNKPTNALIKMNSHYKNMNIVVEVYQETKLVGSKHLSMKEESSVNFGSIIIK